MVCVRVGTVLGVNASWAKVVCLHVCDVYITALQMIDKAQPTALITWKAMSDMRLKARQVLGKGTCTESKRHGQTCTSHPLIMLRDGTHAGRYHSTNSSRPGNREESPSSSISHNLQEDTTTGWPFSNY